MSRRRGTSSPVATGPLAVLAAVLAAALLAVGAAPSARAQTGACPGAADPCPYVSVTQVGQIAGVLRFPQAVAVAADGTVYVGDQTSHVVHVFNPDGSVRGVIGAPGMNPGQIMAVASVAVGAQGLFVAEGRSNRVLRFTADGQPLGSFGGPGEGPGHFRFGAGGGHDAPAGGGLALAGGFVYVSDTGNDRVQRLQPDGTSPVEIIPRGLLANPRGITVWGGRIFVADDRHHRVAVFDIAGRPLASMGTQGTGPAQLNFPYGVAVDPAGRVFVADDLNHRVVRFGVLPRYPYQARWGSYGTGPGQLAFPRNIATDAAGRVYVTNTGDDRVDVFDRSGTLLRSFGSDARVPGQFDAPTGIAADASGVVGVVDTTNGRLQLLGPDGGVAAVWGSPNPGPTVLKHPVAVAFDGAGSAYVADDRRNRVVIFSRDTGLPTRTLGDAGELSGPSALAVAPDGSVLVADRGHGRIVRYAVDGSFAGVVAKIADPRGLALAPDASRIYVSQGANRIAILGADGAPQATFAGTGSKPGKLNAPGQLTVDGAGNVWVADKGNSRVQEFGPDGAHLLTLGTRGTGPGQFVNPSAVAVDCRGVLSVADTLGNRVQRFALAAAPPAACAAIPAPAQPPAPQRPTLPLAPGPQVGLRLLRTSGLLTTRTLPLRLRCDTICDIGASATLTPRSAPRRGHRQVEARFPVARLHLTAGQSGVLRLRLSRWSAQRLASALHGRSGLQLSLYIEAVGASGDVTTISQDELARR